MAALLGKQFPSVISRQPGVKDMSLWTGIVMLVIGLLLIFFGRPDRNGVHRRFLRFNAAMVLYPPLVLIFIALGAAVVIGALTS